jgi:hypothetical protein
MQIFSIIRASEKFRLPFLEDEAVLVVINKVESYPYLGYCPNSRERCRSCMNGRSSEVEVPAIMQKYS